MREAQRENTYFYNPRSPPTAGPTVILQAFLVLSTVGWIVSLIDLNQLNIFPQGIQDNFYKMTEINQTVLMD